MLGSIEPVSHDYVSFHKQGRIAIVTFIRGNPLDARRRPRPYAASMAFSRCSHSSSAVDLAPVGNSDYEHDQPFVLDPADGAVVPDPVAP